MVKPSTVAATMPHTATSSVFRKPTAAATQVRVAGVVVDEGGEGDVVGGGGAQEVEAELLPDRFEVDGDVVESDRHQVSIPPPG